LWRDCCNSQGADFWGITWSQNGEQMYGLDKTTQYLAVQPSQSCSAPAPLLIQNGELLQPMLVRGLATSVIEQSLGDNIPHVYAGVHLDDILIGFLWARIEVI
jgi:hypothetical protein